MEKKAQFFEVKESEVKAAERNIQVQGIWKKISANVGRIENKVNRDRNWYKMHEE